MSTRKIAAVLIALTASLLAAAPGALAAPAPAWKLTVTPLPANFAPGAEGGGISGPMFFPVATNVGAAPTAGPITLTTTLPLGLTPVDFAPINGDPSASNPDCEIAPPAVICKTTDPLNPGHFLGARVVVDVAPEASGVLSAETSIVGGGAKEAKATTAATIGKDPVPFDFLHFEAPFTNEDGAPTTQAGSRPYQLTVDIGFPVEKVGASSLSGTEHPRDVIVDLPRGAIANPAATTVLCTEAELTSAGKPGCPAASQVGVVSVMTMIAGPTPVIAPLYNMVPPPGTAASLGFDALKVGAFVHLLGEVRSDGDYGLSGGVHDILARGVNPVLSVQTQLWGDPTSESHDKIRECFGIGETTCKVDPSERPDTAFLTMPGECTGEPAVTGARTRSWEEPDVFKEASYESADLGGEPVSVDGCNQLEFKPTIEAQPSTNLTDSPSGLRFKLHQPQDFDLGSLSTAAQKDAFVTLPEGMVANPSQAGGLKACGSEQIGLETEIGESPARFDKAPAKCPEASKLGKVEVTTPLLAEVDESGTKVQRDAEGNPIPRPVEGALYLAAPFDNPFGSLLAIYIVIEDAKTGTVAKLAGEVIPDPITGQLATRFEENPQLPVEDIELELFEGPRAPLRTPPACATHTTATTFTPWSAPEGLDAHPTDSFALSAAPGGGTCPSTAAGAPHSPAFSAGTLFPRAGAFTPLLVKVSREDGSQNLAGFETTLAPGLLGKLAGVASCSEAQIAQALARGEPTQGALELANPSCPAASEVGVVDVGAGAGITPYYAQGRIYRAGPYKSAPLSFVVITPAVAGPFDLGVVVVRVATYLDPVSAQVRAVSDPLPTILEGIPLDVRSVAVRLERSSFILNPTSCDEMSIGAIATSVFGQAAPLADRFQLGGCEALPFKPKLSLRLLGGTRRGAHPRLRAVLTAKPGEANIARASVALPRSEFLDQGHIRTVCTRVQFAADQCPPGAVYGHVSAITPLLDEPLEGPVYLRSSSNKLPDTVAALKGPPSLPVEAEVAARIDSIRGGLRANFETVPDVPITKVVVTMQGGRKGLLINSRNLCASTSRATVKMDGQNGKVHDFRPVLENECKKRRKARRRAHR